MNCLLIFWWVFRISNNISENSKHLIMLMLQQEPYKRPKIRQIDAHDFFLGYTPLSLPSSCLSMAPRFDQVESLQRRPLIEVNGILMFIFSNQFIFKFVFVNLLGGAAASSVSPSKPRNSIAASGVTEYRTNRGFDPRENLLILRKMLTDVLAVKPARSNQNFGDEMSDPAAQPLIWISKWVDYSDKYGFGYQLCDESVGVMFNDSTKLILLPNAM